MRIENLYNLANELDQDLEVSEEFNRDEKIIIMQSVLTFINYLSLEEFDLHYVIEKRNEVIRYVNPMGLKSRAIMSFFYDIELYSQEQIQFEESFNAETV